MSLKADALSARNLIISAVVVLLVSVIWQIAAVLQPNDSGGTARDSYGTQADGYRAVYELMETLKIPTTRSVAPPRNLPVSSSYAIVSPHTQLVRTSPKYLQALVDWVERGGRLVIAPKVREPAWVKQMAQGLDQLEGTPDDILQTLGLDDRLSIDERAGFRVDNPYAESPNDVGGQIEEPEEPHWIDDERFEFLPDEMRDYWKRKAPQSKTWPAESEGTFATIADGVRQVALPAEGFAAIDAERDKLDGALYTRGYDDEILILAAAVRRGQGEIIVVAEPMLLANYLLPQADNSVLVARLLAGGRQGVVFDEFYHGLAVRGNAFYLLTYPAFATSVFAVLIAVVAWAWRSAVFLGPPLQPREPTRRSLGEYVDAMANFLAGGDGSRQLLAQEVRDGVLGELCRRLQLPLETADEGRIIAKLSLRDPGQAERLSAALSQVNPHLAAGRHYPKSQFLPDMQRLTSCL